MSFRRAWKRIISDEPTSSKVLFTLFTVPCCQTRMVTGQFPRTDWRANSDRKARSIEEAVEIAQRFGVSIPKDVAFFVDEYGCLDEHTTARGPKVTKPSGTLVVWSDMLNINDQVPFIIRPDILESDEAIVAVFTHEMHELAELRPLLENVPLQSST